MRIATNSFVVATLLLCSTLANALVPNTRNALDMEAVMAEKLATDRGGGIPSPIYLNVGGDTGSQVAHADHESPLRGTRGTRASSRIRND